MAIPLTLVSIKVCMALCLTHVESVEGSKKTLEEDDYFYLVSLAPTHTYSLTIIFCNSSNAEVSYYKLS